VNVDTKLDPYEKDIEELSKIITSLERYNSPTYVEEDSAGIDELLKQRTIQMEKLKIKVELQMG
jgi:hypothetical protein